MPGFIQGIWPTMVHLPESKSTPFKTETLDNLL